MFLYKKYIFKLLWLLPLFLTCNFIFASEKNSDKPQTVVQEGQIYLTGNVIVYNSLKEKNPVKTNLVKRENTHKLKKVSSKKTLVKTPEKKYRKLAPVFNITQSNPTENFSLSLKNESNAIQNHRERNENKSIEQKLNYSSQSNKIFSNNISAIKSNLYKFDIYSKKFFCRPPPSFI